MGPNGALVFGRAKIGRFGAGRAVSLPCHLRVILALGGPFSIQICSCGKKLDRVICVSFACHFGPAGPAKLNLSPAASCLRAFCLAALPKPMEDLKTSTRKIVGPERISTMASIRFPD